jgi:hypothetical protein
MQPLSRPRLALSLPFALALAVVLASQGLAATWSPPIRLTPELYGGAGLVTLGTSTAVVVYAEAGGVSVRRSTDAGKTWAPSLRLTSATVGPTAIAGRGANVDVVWVENDRLHYARSTNSGASFRTPVALSALGHTAEFPSVARGPNGRVIVAWHDTFSVGSTVSFKIQVRVSTNGGASFGAEKTVETLPAFFDEGSVPVVAVGKGVLYVAYSFDGLRVTRSTNSGSTWDSPRVIATDAAEGPYYPPSMTAAGSAAYVAYVAAGPSGWWVRYTRTTTKGGAWSSPVNLSPKPGAQSGNPQISLRGGVVRVAFMRGPAGSTGPGVFYRQSSNGTSWTTAERVADSSFLTRGVGYAGRIMVLYSTDLGLFVRTAAP